MITAFLIEQMSNMAFARNIIGYGILWADPIINRLHDKQEIHRGDPGFEQIARMLIKELKDPNSKFRMEGYGDSGDISSGIMLLHPRFISVNSSMANANPPLIQRMVRAELKDGGRVMLSMLALDTYSKDLWKRRLFTISIVVFLAGISLAIGNLFF